ncbi:MAG: RNA 2',3'-cyclic phosphodiesterase [Bdellovibrionota bacterium]
MTERPEAPRNYLPPRKSRGDTFRAFIAIPVPEEARKYLTRLSSRIRASGWPGHPKARVKWVEEENFHLTLRFFGNVTKDQERAICEAMKETAAAFEPFETGFGELGGAPSPTRLRVLWAEMKESATIEKIAGRLGQELAARGFPPEERPFRAHATLARVNWEGRPRPLGLPLAVTQGVTALRYREKDAGKGAEKGDSGDRKKTVTFGGPGVESPPGFVIQGFSLFESRLTPKGPRYRERFSAKLGSIAGGA